MNPHDPNSPSPEESPNPYAAPEQNPYPRPDFGGGTTMLGPRKVDFAVIGEAFNILTKNVGPVVMCGLIAFLPVGIAGFLGWSLVLGVAMANPDPNNPMAGLMAQLVFMLFMVAGLAFAGIGNYGAATIALNHRRGNPITMDMATAGLKRFFPSLVFALLQSLAIQIGSMCCYLPGFILGGLVTPGFAVLAEDESAGVGDAFTKSIETMKPQLWMATALYFVLSLIAGLGVIACGIGIIATFPLLAMGMTLAYCDMAYGMGGSDRRPA